MMSEAAWTADTSFQDTIITKVEHEGSAGGWFVTKDDGWSLFVPPETTVRPTVGMKIRTYGHGIGSAIRGIFLDGVKVFYRTEEEDAAKHKHDMYGTTPG